MSRPPARNERSTLCLRDRLVRVNCKRELDSATTLAPFEERRQRLADWAAKWGDSIADMLERGES